MPKGGQNVAVCYRWRMNQIARPPADPLDGLWLFDGVCNFCAGSVQIALRLA
jgi:hypothetical protein